MRIIPLGETESARRIFHCLKPASVFYRFPWKSSRIVEKYKQEVGRKKSRSISGGMSLRREETGRKRKIVGKVFPRRKQGPNASVLSLGRFRSRYDSQTDFISGGRKLHYSLC